MPNENSQCNGILDSEIWQRATADFISIIQSAMSKHSAMKLESHGDLHGLFVDMDRHFLRVSQFDTQTYRAKNLIDELSCERRQAVGKNDYMASMTVDQFMEDETFISFVICKGHIKMPAGLSVDGDEPNCAAIFQFKLDSPSDRVTKIHIESRGLMPSFRGMKLLRPLSMIILNSCLHF